MELDELTIGQARELAKLFTGTNDRESGCVDNGMIDRYVIVRCHDAGVHAGFLDSYNGRSCVLSESRRLWYWKPKNKASNLSGVATEGLHIDSKVGAPVLIHLTETCEIILCTGRAKTSIMEKESHVQ